MQEIKTVGNFVIPAIDSVEIDRRLAPVLRKMEERGVRLDVKRLRQLELELERKMGTLRKKITDLAGEEVNLDSPKQLSELLFTTLHIPTDGIKKTKTGYSTDADQLQRLAGDYPIAKLLLVYRELTKLLSTYIRPLPELVDSHGRLHTTYAPDTTSGRISSRNPNLQNIPVRTEAGRKIRAAFIAPKGKMLIKADYSQIELRIAACFAGEQSMIAAFQAEEDIHRQTAAEVLNKPLAEVSESERRFAKTINFGILYGMGAYGLSTTLQISRAEAQAYIDQYFLSHPQLRHYIDQALVAARKTGQAKNIFGRVREIPELNSPIDQVRRSGERMAVNMPIQGTAAEILKLAMIELEPKLQKLNAQLLLTVHDELLIEVPRDVVKKVAKLVKEIMEGTVKLCVPLLVDISSGESWDNTRSL